MAAAPVHPRSRGEHRTDPPDTDLAAGSSPLARGTHARKNPMLPCARFIPARAGNTASCSPAISASPVHPRSRGEHSSPIARMRQSAGSSPLARGTPIYPGISRIPIRFIPARAGNTRRRTRPTPRRPVHPRSRGEHVLHAAVRFQPVGSSPLARGTLVVLIREDDGGRFIPARAGNTSEAQAALLLLPGSSPLARGTQGPPLPDPTPVRFIPARAGNTSSICVRWWYTSVHPRSRAYSGPK